MGSGNSFEILYNLYIGFIATVMLPQICQLLTNRTLLNFGGGGVDFRECFWLFAELLITSAAYVQKAQVVRAHIIRVFEVIHFKHFRCCRWVRLITIPYRTISLIYGQVEIHQTRSLLESPN